MGSAKDIRLRPIPAKRANALVKRVHYSGKVVQNSQLHIGVFYRGALEGAMQFGPPLDKRKVLPLVDGTPWNGMLELNRLAFTDRLPRNSESRALGVAMRMLRKHAPHVGWVLSFADATQCGDGTIYRASGFVLTGIKRNNSIWVAPDGEYYSDHAQRTVSRTTLTKGEHTAASGGRASMAAYKKAGFRPLLGHQLRYIYFLDPTARARLTVPEIPFSEIERRGAAMYRGERRTVDASEGEESSRPATSGEQGGASPTPALHTQAAP